MNKANVYNWIKKPEVLVESAPDVFELDELYWFIERKPRTETRENIHVMAMVGRQPRQIVRSTLLLVNHSVTFSIW